MICIIQRVDSSEVIIQKKIISKIKKGILVFLCIEKNDSQEDIEYIVNKTSNLRIFADNKNNMNLSIKDIKGDILLVSQFTLCANIKRGRRPSFINAADPKIAKVFYKNVINEFKDLNLRVNSGEFGSNMMIKTMNNGPVTIIINSKEKNEN